MHVGSVALFELPAQESFDYEALCELVAQRISLQPRYRQKVRWVPGHLANPVWVDDENFDIAYHVRRSALPRPGSEDQLRELVGRVQSRSLDRDRPLWELYLVEGLAGAATGRARFAIITKVHHAVAGDGGIDITSLLLDTTADPPPVLDDGWTPAREPSPLELLTSAIADNLRQPTQVLDTLRSEVTDVKAAAARAFGAAGGVFSAVRKSLRPAPASPLNVTVGEQRRFGMAAPHLQDYPRGRQGPRGAGQHAGGAPPAG